MLAFIVVDGLCWSPACGSSVCPANTSATSRCWPRLLSLYPLTIFPFAGLGVLDASLIVLVNAEGVADPADLVAAMVIWRAATLLLPLVPGVMALTHWRAREARRGKATADPFDAS